jgi:hypothetical protein
MVQFFAVRLMAMVGGQVDSEKQFKSVVTFGQFQCSAVKISKFHFLTAAHCVTGVSKDVTSFMEVPPQLRKTLVKMDPKNVLMPSLKTIYLHPSWKNKIKTELSIDSQIESQGLSDLAIIELEDETQAIPEMAIRFEKVPVGTSLFIGGYGRKTEDQMDEDYDFFTFAQRTYLLDHLEFFAVDPRSSVDQSLAYLRTGDSGGPVMVKTSTGEFQVIGINSWGDRFKIKNADGTSTEALPIYFAARLDSSAGSPNVRKWLCGVTKIASCR